MLNQSKRSKTEEDTNKTLMTQEGKTGATVVHGLLLRNSLPDSSFYLAQVTKALPFGCLQLDYTLTGFSQDDMALRSVTVDYE